MSTSIVIPHFDCAVCAARVATKQAITQHVLVHAGLNRKYECELCCRSYLSKKAADTHRRRQHGQVRRKGNFGCDLCDKHYRLKADLVRHCREKHPVSEGAFACAKCGSRHPDPPSLLVHLKRCSPVIKCNVCQKTFLRQCVLKQHMHLHSDQKPFTCELCPYATGWKSQLVKHRKSHLVKRTFRCDECAASFTLEKHLVTHRRVHAVKCKLCPPQFTKFGAQKRSRCPHITVKACKCEVCGAAFVSVSAISKHRRKMHKPPGPSSAKTFACPHCPARYDFKVSLDRHVVVLHTHSSQATKKHVCEICQSSFKDAVYLKQHHRYTHLRKCFCAQCGHRASSKSNLRVHLSALHSVEKLFKCAVCMRSYHSTHTLRGHMALHVYRLKRHRCGICVARFLTLGQLRNHSRHHGGFGNFQCVTCGAQFALKSALTEHIVAQHFSSTAPHFPWLHCDICRKRFATIEKLTAHEKQHAYAQQGYLCDACGKIFKSDRGQRSHSLKEHGHFAYGCARCLRRYRSRLSLLQHLGRDCWPRRPCPSFRMSRAANKGYETAKAYHGLSTAAQASPFTTKRQAARTPVKTEPVGSGISMASKERLTCSGLKPSHSLATADF